MDLMKKIVVSIDDYAKQKKWTFCILQIKVLKAKAVPKYVVDIGLNVIPPIHMYHEIKNFNKYFWQYSML